MSTSAKNRLDTFSKVARYIFLGVATYFYSLYVTRWLVSVLEMEISLAFAITQTTLYIMNFITARYWVFKESTSSFWRQGIMFLISNAIFRGVTWVLFVILVGWLSYSDKVAVAASIAVVAPLKYLIFNYWVFRKPMSGVAS